VLQAVCAGDEAAAAEAMRQHIGAGGEAMMALVRAAEALG
jgi:DNA-binding GntR family transcriptional regulator